MVKVNNHRDPPVSMQPLSSLKPGDAARLGAFPALELDLARELSALRLMPGEAVTVLALVGGGGPVLIQGAGGVFALGRRLAGRLMAEPLVPCH